MGRNGWASTLAVQQHSLPRRHRRPVRTVVGECVRRCVLLVGSDLRGFWTRQAAASAQRPGSSSSSRAERRMIYFRGKDVGIQRGHIYSLFVWPEDVPVKARNSEKENKSLRRDESYFQGVETSGVHK